MSHDDDRGNDDDTAPTGWNPEATASFWINRTSRVVLRANDARLKAFGFSMSQMPVLHALQDGVAKSQKELAQLARIEQPTMAEMLTRMERDGVIERAPNPRDGRGSLISLTRRSRSRWVKAKQALLDGEAEALVGFNDVEKAVLIALLQRVLDNVQSAAFASSSSS